MTDREKKKKGSSIVCPHCGAPAGGAFSTVVEADDAGPIEVLYKCQSCGRFYTAKRVISWEVIKQ
jgi:DNA-directed RNA polymerase subunit RPC12/RpoP